MKKFITEDGSETFFNETYQEAYHSKYGACQEALYKHVIACKIQELAAMHQQLNILDVCFGLAYNTLVCVHEAVKVNPDILLNVTALENDRQIFHLIEEITYPQELDLYVSSILKLRNQKDLILKDKNLALEIILDDARESIKSLPDNFYHAVFFDPFSPKVCPDLWTQDFIGQVVNKASPGSFISTYSSSRVAKDAFKNAGCILYEGPACGRRQGGVLALKQI